MVFTIKKQFILPLYIFIQYLLSIIHTCCFIDYLKAFISLTFPFMILVFQFLISIHFSWTAYYVKSLSVRQSVIVLPTYLSNTHEDILINYLFMYLWLPGDDIVCARKEVTLICVSFFTNSLMAIVSTGVYCFA